MRVQKLALRGALVLGALALALAWRWWPRLPESDARLGNPRDCFTAVEPRRFRDRATYEARRKRLELQVRVSLGLFPSGPRVPHEAWRGPAEKRDGYALAPVKLEVVPGLFVFGDLFLPETPGPHPGLLHAHGHKPQGRRQDDELFSPVAASIALARSGRVVLAYDMIGYGQTLQLEHDELGPRAALWGVSLMGLQTLDSQAALEFLAAQPEVDPKQLGMFGWSGGGTQTEFLSLLEPRIEQSFPIVIVSHTVQDNCDCGNSPLLRYDTDNVELAGLTAPRRQQLISCSGDFTGDTPRVEFPILQSYYALLGARDQVSYRQTDFMWHNFNRATREALYQSFPGATETGYQPLPPLSEEKLPPYQVDGLIELFRKLPYQASRQAFEVGMGLELPTRVRAFKQDDGSLVLTRPERGDRVRIRWTRPEERPVTLVVGRAAGELPGSVVEVDVIPTLGLPRLIQPTTYHPSLRAEQTQDILTALAYLRSQGVERPRVVGGLTALVAAALWPDVGTTVVDVDGFAMDRDEAYLESFDVPLFRRLGDFRALHELLPEAQIHDTRGEWKWGESRQLSWDEIRSALTRE